MQALTLAMLLLGCERDAAPPTRALPPLPARVDEVAELSRGAARPVRELVLALVGEVRGEVQPCGCPTLPFGGFARRERLLGQLAGEGHGPVFQLDAGELLLKGQTTRAPDPERIGLLLDLQEEVGVDVWVPGPTDLAALGLEGLRERARREAGPRVVSATWTDDTGALALPPSAVVERAGLRLGVIGLAAPPTGARRVGLKARDPVEAAREALAALPADLDLVVALGNVADGVADHVAKEVPGLGAVLTIRGAAYDEPRVEGVGQTPVIEAPDRGRYLMVVRARLGAEARRPLLLEPEARAWRDLDGLSRVTGGDAETSARKAALEARFQELNQGRNLAFAEAVPLGTQLEGEARVSRRLAAWRADALAEAVAAAAAPTTPVERGFASSGDCVNCHTAEFARWAFSDHAKAWDALVMRRQTNEPECVACHATGYGQPGGLGELTPANVRRLKSVQCEACHGPLAGHPDDDAVKPRPITAQTCLGCHDEANSPQFDYATYLPRATCQGGAPATPAAPAAP